MKKNTVFNRSRGASTRRSGRKLAMLAVLLSVAIPAIAADQQTTGIRVFTLDFFAGTQARTARDLIGRLPGFTFDEGGDDVRGYSGSTGNVMIDGNRPASKYGQLGDILDRIPVNSVERIELIRGSAPGVNMQGHSVVANVVRRSGASLTALAELGAILHGDGRVLPQGKLEGSRRSGESLVEASIRAFDFPNEGGIGYQRQVDSTGNLVRDASMESSFATAGIDTTVAFERALAEGEFRMNAVFKGRNRRGDRLVAERLADSDRQFVTEEVRDHQAEIGASFDRELSATSTMQLLTIFQRQSFDGDEQENENGVFEEFSEDRNRGESIVRAIVRSSSPGRSVEWGGEAVFNFLHSNAAVSRDGDSVQLPNDSVEVEERRGEVFGLVNWAVRSRVSTELGAAYEFSKISQRGDTQSSKSLSYFKPRAMLSWTPSRTRQVRLSVERSVDQLEFDDFVSSAELSTGTINAGNVELIPSTSWDVVAAWEQQILGSATSVISLSHSRISDVIDIVPLYADTDGDGTSEVFEGLGNIGDGTKNELGIELSIPLDGIGVSGGLLKSDLRYIQASVVDPFTGETRHISDTEDGWSGEFVFTQDLPDWRFRWGAKLELAESEPEYRSDEIRDERQDPRYELYGEYFLTSNWAVEMKLRNLSQRERLRTRSFFDAPRGVGALESVRVESRRTERSLEIKVLREFP